MSSRPPAARSAPGRLVELSTDVRAAVLVDSAGALVAASDDDRDRARRLAELARELIEAADAAAPEPTEQIEARVDGGAVFAVRTVRHTLACVARRLALPALVLYDLRQTMLELERAA
ncbi:MAG: roadblock/LC7 domain-containing protein [Thermoleophilaceae bacterium]